MLEKKYIREDSRNLAEEFWIITSVIESSSFTIIIIMGSVGKDYPQELPLRGKTGAAAFGSSMKKDFMLDPEWRNMNHGM